MNVRAHQVKGQPSVIFFTSESFMFDLPRHKPHNHARARQRIRATRTIMTKTLRILLAALFCTSLLHAQETPAPPKPLIDDNGGVTAQQLVIASRLPAIGAWWELWKSGKGMTPKRGFASAWKDVPFKDRVTLPSSPSNNPKYPPFPDACFDHVFVKGAKVVSARVVTFDPSPSDHRPVVVDIELPASPQ